MSIYHGIRLGHKVDTNTVTKTASHYEICMPHREVAMLFISLQSHVCTAQHTT